MFKVPSKQSLSNKFVWLTAQVEIIGEDAVRSINKLKVKFKVPTQSKLDEYRKGFAENTLTDAQFLNEVMLDWKEVGDENGIPLEFTPENVADTLEVYPTRPTLVNTFFNNINDAVRKN